MKTIAAVLMLIATTVVAQSVPVVTITQPAVDGIHFQCGTIVDFSAIASDGLEDLSPYIQWRSIDPMGIAGPWIYGATLSASFNCGSLGNYVMQAAVTDADGTSAQDQRLFTICRHGKCK